MCFCDPIMLLKMIHKVKKKEDFCENKDRRNFDQQTTVSIVFKSSAELGSSVDRMLLERTQKLSVTFDLGSA